MPDAAASIADELDRVREHAVGIIGDLNAVGVTCAIFRGHHERVLGDHAEVAGGHRAPLQ